MRLIHFTSKTATCFFYQCSQQPMPHTTELLISERAFYLFPSQTRHTKHLEHRAPAGKVLRVLALVIIIACFIALGMCCLLITKSFHSFQSMIGAARYTRFLLYTIYVCWLSVAPSRLVHLPLEAETTLVIIKTFLPWYHICNNHHGKNVIHVPSVPVHTYCCRNGVTMETMRTPWLRHKDAMVFDVIMVIHHGITTRLFITMKPQISIAAALRGFRLGSFATQAEARILNANPNLNPK